MSLAERIAHAFGGAKRSSSGWQCKCPCHEDKTASLGVIDNKDDSNDVIFNCLAGCNWEDIKAEAKRQGLLDRPKTSTTKINSGSITYRYYDESGKEICQKIRYPGKKFSIQRYQNGTLIKNAQGVEVPLYNLPSVITNNTIYLVEGEKDADNLIKHGLCATTNIAGGAHWNEKYNRYFKDKIVIICQDNDKTGRERTQKLQKALTGIVKELYLFEPPNVPEKGDVSDWLEIQGNKPEDILSLSKQIAVVTPKKHATREDYFKLFERVFKSPKKCIFSRKLMMYDPSEDLWNPAINHLDIARSESLVANETADATNTGKFSAAAIQPHFFAYEASKEPEFLIDIPKWDGDDRISAMCYLVKLKEEAGVSDIAFSELVKEWCSLVFQRLYDPMVQNRILVLQGGQGVGKDTWISMLCDGLGQFCIPLSIVNEDKDTYLNLHRGLIMKIAEFDKTAKTEVSTLKDIVTAPSTNLRAPYDRDARVRVNRCSFISSANAENLLRDSTGNRRYLIFEVNSIEYAYVDWTKEQIKAWQMQCLAEMKALSEMRYKASADSWRQINQYIEQETPTDPADWLVEEFIHTAKAYAPLILNSEREIGLYDSTVVEITKDLAKNSKMTRQGVLRLLKKRLGKYKRIGQKRFWVLKIPESSTYEDTVPDKNGLLAQVEYKPLQQDIDL